MKQTRKRRSNLSREFRLPANVMHEEAWEDSGPNMKLSRAFIVVLVLHIVAVAGLVAFNMFDNKKTKVGSTTTLPENLVTANVKNKPRTEPTRPITPSGPIVMEGMRAVKIKKQMSTALFALQYELTEESLLEMNKHTPLVQGPLLPGELVYVPEAATRHTAIGGLPVAPVVATPIETARPIITETVVQPRPPRETYTPPTPIITETVVQPRPPRETYTPPTPKKKVASNTPKKPTRTPQTSSGSSHKVKNGDNLYQIALKYGVTVEALQRANGISDAKKLRVGKILKIPK
ncbi:MAG: LysM repeat protein [Verrucomicrobiales bacterium]|jgi:LysM repeat protein